MGKSKKRPVLTSPWKIGVFVAMMMVITSFGAGYYITYVYDIDLTWLKGHDARWIIDSYQFFKELYPVVAGVLLIALFSYFNIASAVRRYKFYLASGQDYTKMISLADSIDDLTNPAQIAKLSDYPALQNILRNYGDQIKEISSEISEMSEEEKSVELEMEIDSILGGNEVQETIIEGHWWASLALKINEYAATNREKLRSLEKQVEDHRRASGQISLSIGKIAEYTSAANEDIIRIARDLGGLNSAASRISECGLNRPAPNDGSEGGIPSDGQDLVREAVTRIAENSRVLESFSEENNGLALNMALMAAKGDASEQNLAQFAEKLRETAERFSRISTETSEAVQILNGNIAAERGAYTGTSGGEIDVAGISESITQISNKIEERSHSLQDMIINLGNELELLDRTLHPITEDEFSEEPALEQGESRSDDGSGSSDDSELIIDHGKIWEGDTEGDEERSEHDFETAYLNDDEAPPGDPVESEEISIIGSGVEQAGTAGVETPEAAYLDESAEEEPSEEPEAADDVSQRAVNDKIYDIPENAELKSSEGPQDEGDWMEMPGNNWKKVDVAEEAETQPEEDGTLVSDAPVHAEETDMDAYAADSLGKVTDAILAASEKDLAFQDKGISDPIQTEAGEEEPVYDLFELGAVEYVENA